MSTARGAGTRPSSTATTSTTSTTGTGTPATRATTTNTAKRSDVARSSRHRAGEHPGDAPDVAPVRLFPHSRVHEWAAVGQFDPAVVLCPRCSDGFDVPAGT